MAQITNARKNLNALSIRLSTTKLFKLKNFYLYLRTRYLIYNPAIFTRLIVKAKTTLCRPSNQARYSLNKIPKNV